MTLDGVVQKANETSQESLTPKNYSMFTASKPVDSDRKWLDVSNKYTKDVAARVPLATHKDIDGAIDAAVSAAPAMAAMAAYERKAILEKVVAELKTRAKEIAQTLTMESGKPIKDARGNREEVSDRSCFHGESMEFSAQSCSTQGGAGNSSRLFVRVKAGEQDAIVSSNSWRHFAPY